MPENDSTGGKVKQKGLSKRGDRYLRSLLVTGAMAIVRQAKIRPDKHPWVVVAGWWGQRNTRGQAIMVESGRPLLRSGKAGAHVIFPVKVDGYAG